MTDKPTEDGYLHIVFTDGSSQTIPFKYTKGWQPRHDGLHIRQANGYTIWPWINIRCIDVHRNSKEYMAKLDEWEQSFYEKRMTTPQSPEEFETHQKED